jgi:hypothetical protein
MTRCLYIFSEATHTHLRLSDCLCPNLWSVTVLLSWHIISISFKTSEPNTLLRYHLSPNCHTHTRSGSLRIGITCNHVRLEVIEDDSLELKYCRETIRRSSDASLDECKLWSSLKMTYKNSCYRFQKLLRAVRVSFILISSFMWATIFICFTEASTLSSKVIRLS